MSLDPLKETPCCKHDILNGYIFKESIDEFYYIYSRDRYYVSIIMYCPYCGEKLP